MSTTALIPEHVAAAIQACTYTTSFFRREYYLQGNSEFERMRNARGPQVTHELTFAFASGYQYVLKLDAAAVQVVTDELTELAATDHLSQMLGTARALLHPGFAYAKDKGYGVTLYAESANSPSGVESCGAAQNKVVVLYLAGLLGINAYIGQPFERLSSSAGFQNTPMQS